VVPGDVRVDDGAADERPWRLFMALPVPHEAAAAIAHLCAPYRRRFPLARWLAPESLHVTLVFLGAVPPAGVDDVLAVMSRAADAGAAFPVATGPGGGRVRGDDGVAWLGLATGSGAVIGLAAALARGLPEGLTRDRRGPRRTPDAHLTVARRADRGLVAALRDQALGPLRTAWRADRIVLMRSHLGPGGSAYEEVGARTLRP
jgi:RNA 2',3'-cyclic 3'-phosphodiesterase